MRLVGLVGGDMTAATNALRATAAKADAALRLGDVQTLAAVTANGVKIINYQVIVNQGDRELSMYLPPTATSATIPGEFLEPATETGGELLAREKSGNQTITAFPSFRTK